MVTVLFYTRRGCHLCEEAARVLELVAAETEFSLTVIDIDSDPAAKALYHEDIPVTVLPNGRRFRYTLDKNEFQTQLSRLGAHRKSKYSCDHPTS
jgi:glutaredoxin